MNSCPPPQDAQGGSAQSCKPEDTRRAYRRRRWAGEMALVLNTGPQRTRIPHMSRRLGVWTEDVAWLSPDQDSLQPVEGTSSVCGAGEGLWDHFLSF